MIDESKSAYNDNRLSSEEKKELMRKDAVEKKA